MPFLVDCVWESVVLEYSEGLRGIWKSDNERDLREGSQCVRVRMLRRRLHLRTTKGVVVETDEMGGIRTSRPLVAQISPGYRVG